MNRRDTDELLAELFKRNAPSVDERALQERIDPRLSSRRKRSRRVRIARTAALASACVALATGAAFGIYTLVDYAQSEPAIVFVYIPFNTGGTSPGSGPANQPFLARVLPVMGTAVLEQVRNQGTSNPDEETEGIHAVRGRVEVYRLNMSHPFVNGTMDITFDVAIGATGVGDVSGSWELHTDQGTWKSSLWAGSLPADGEERFYFGRATGTGGLEGLLLLLEWHSGRPPGSAPGPEWQSQLIAVTGWIQATK
jgi:hypothetical protein